MGGNKLGKKKILQNTFINRK